MSASYLAEGFRDDLIRLEQAKDAAMDHWSDAIARQFQDQYWREIEIEGRACANALDELDAFIAAASQSLQAG